MHMHMYIYKHTHATNTYTVLIILKEIIKYEGFLMCSHMNIPTDLYETVYV